MAVLCFQSYVVKTPRHTILVDACIGNDKSFPHRPTWHRKSDSTSDYAVDDHIRLTPTPATHLITSRSAPGAAATRRCSPAI